MTTIDTVANIKKLIAEPYNWTQGCAARNSIGHPCAPHEEDAVRFSLIGALDRLFGLSSDKQLSAASREIADTLARRLGYSLPLTTNERVIVPLLSAFNDLTNHAGVIKVLEDTVDRLTKPTP